ncbi:hypothetical protein [Microbacterium sp. 179-I 3D3 NHS]|uniref:hypothetical protein n=1 Tax=Microbacterium sp. 179-I 3D3 NHS TaxID=3142382 RepID=UPI0039A388C6
MSGAPSLRSGYRRWFLVDGVVTGANAVAYLALHRQLSDLLGSAPTLYAVAGAILAIIAVGLLVVAFSRRRPRLLPEVLAVVNLLWSAASLVVALANPFQLNGWGVGWTGVQGVIVLAFAVLQLRALRRSEPRLETRT